MPGENNGKTGFCTWDSVTERLTSVCCVHIQYFVRLQSLAGDMNKLLIVSNNVHLRFYPVFVIPVIVSGIFSFTLSHYLGAMFGCILHTWKCVGTLNKVLRVQRDR